MKNALHNTTMHWLCCAILLLFSSNLQAQKIPAAIAPFKITLANGQTLSAAQLQKNKPTALIYFDPDCEHCVLLTKELLRQQEHLKSKQIIMITYRPLNIIKEFDKSVKLSSVANIKMGTEMETFIVRKYYSIYTFPFIALYKADGKLAGVYDKDMNDLTGIRKVVNAIRLLK